MTTQNRELASLIDNSGNVTATGNLTVSGTTTTISSTVQTIADPLIELNTGAGSNSNDLGFVFERGSTGNNACLIWDESADAFAVGTTTATGTSTGNMSYTTGDFLAGKVTVDNVIINGTTIGHTDDTDLMTLADGALTVAGTASITGALTLGDYIEKTSGNLTIDVAGDIHLDADGGDVTFKDAGTQIGSLSNSSSDFVITSAVQDKDIIFKGDDGGSAITALTLDMSDAGTATFNHDVKLGDSNYLVFGAGTDFVLHSDGTHAQVEAGNGNLVFDISGQIHLDSDGGVVDFKDGGTEIGRFENASSDFKLESRVQDKDIVFVGNDNGTGVEAARFDMSAGGHLGIGTGATVDTQLHVKSAVGIELRLEADSNNSGQEDCFVRFYTDGKTQEGIAGMDNNNSSTLFTGNTENAMVFGTVSNLPTILATNNTERFHITAGGDVSIKVGKKLALSADEDTYFMEYAANEIGVYTGGTIRAKWSGGNYLPGADNSYDLGGIGSRWRNLYTTDLHMSNENGGNKVDGTWGNYTIQEGEDELYLINHRNGKSYKFNLTEVTPSVSGDLDSSLPGE